MSKRGPHKRAATAISVPGNLGIMDRTDGLNVQGDARWDLAGVLAAGGRHDEALAALTEALDRYERKRNLAMARRVRDRLATGAVR